MVAYHVNEHRGNNVIAYAHGAGQWLGDGYYFWQDREFAEEWIPKIKDNMRRKGIADPKVDLYTVEIDFDISEIIDTAFHEEDYYEFAKSIEMFANRYIAIFKKKPNLNDFNSFITDSGIDYWNQILGMRFQDSPMNSKKSYLLVEGYPYKKRIQMVFRDLSKIRIAKKEIL